MKYTQGLFSGKEVLKMTSSYELAEQVMII